MPGAIGGGILTPGRGPNGPGPLDMRRPISSVGEGSSVPYGPTDGYANPGGVTGFIGPAAGSLQLPTAWYVRAGGANTNGGTSASTAPDRNGVGDATIANGSFNLTVTSGNFTSADIGKGICLVGAAGVNLRAKIIRITSSTVVQIDHLASAAFTNVNWAIGGAVADLRAMLGDSAVCNGSTNGVRPGDTIYVGAGTYRTVTSVGASFGNYAMLFQTSVANVQNVPMFNGQVNVVGDVTGQFTGDAGMVQVTAYTTNDKTVPSATVLLNLNGRSNFAFGNIMFVGGNAALLTPGAGATTAVGFNLSFVDCAFRGVWFNANGIIVSATVQYGVKVSWRFDRCVFLEVGNVGGMAISIAGTLGPADYNMNIRIVNCQFIDYGSGQPVFRIQPTGAGAGLCGGVIFRNCDIKGAGLLTASVSTVFPVQIYNSTIESGQGSPLNAAVLGQIIEDYNWIFASVPRTNVATGAHSVSDGSYAPLFHFGQERIWGALLRRFGEPMAGSPFLGFGNDGAQTLYDLANGPRPAGAGAGNNPQLPAVGALERSNTAAQGTVPAPTSGTHVWQNTGPWYQDFLLPVSAVASGFSIQVQRDAAYAPPPGATLPALLILANPGIGVAAQTIVDTGAAAQWNTLTAAAFNPTGIGWVTIRIASYDGSGASVVSFALATPS